LIISRNRSSRKIETYKYIALSSTTEYDLNPPTDNKFNFQAFLIFTSYLFLLSDTKEEGNASTKQRMK
jgi:hypothetical protein